MEKNILITSIIIMLLLVTPVGASKISDGDSWQYTDSNDNVYSETVLGIRQITSSDNVVAAAELQTDRGFDFPTALSLGGFEFDLTYSTSGSLYVTQEGGLPIFANKSFTGTISYDSNTLLTLDNQTLDWEFNGNPARAFSTAESETFMVQCYFPISGNDNIAYLRQYYIISTDQPVTDTVRNYTVTLSRTQVRLDVNETTYDADSSLLLSGNAFLDQQSQATKITWDAAEKVPTYISQTEPANILSLSLNDINQYRTVEYFLVVDKTKNTPTSKLPVQFIVSIIIVAVVLARRRYF